MLGLDKLINKLKDLRTKEAEEEENLRIAQKQVKEAKSSISKIKKEMLDIVDELSGKKSFPLFDQITEQNPLVQLAPKELITFERVGKRGSDFDCVFFYQGENVFNLSFDKIELKLIGEDPASYKDYLDLSDTAWKELQNADQETLQELIRDLTPRSTDKFAWKIDDSTKPTIITLMKGQERKVVPDNIARLVDIQTFNPFKCKWLWEQLEVKQGIEAVSEPQPQEQTFKKSFHEQYQEARLKDLFDIWVTQDRKIEMTFRGEKRTFGDNAMIGHLCAYFRVPQLSDIAQISLAEIWHHPEQFQPKPKLQPVAKPAKQTKTSKKKTATVAI